MIHQSFAQIVDSLAAKTPTPGGGAAAAMSGCMGAALFLMVVRFSRGKKANVDREGDLQQAEALLDGHMKRLLPMAERDCRSFDLVSAAYGMPKETDEQKALREKAIQEGHARGDGGTRGDPVHGARRVRLPWSSVIPLHRQGDRE